LENGRDDRFLSPSIGFSTALDFENAKDARESCVTQEPRTQGARSAI